MVTKVLFGWFIGSFLATVAGATALESSLRFAKPSLTAGEPIGILIKITNAGTGSVGLNINYPTFVTAESTGLSFQITSEAARDSAFTEGRIPIVSLKPGESWSVEVFLQRFLADPGLGRKEITYRLEIPYSSEQGRQKISRAGKLALLVEPPNAEALTASLEHYSQQLESQSYWELRSAVEALSLVKSPAVIPYLAKMLRAGFAREALDALERFSAERSAQLVVLEALGSPQFATVVRALDTLARWRYELKDNELRDLAHRPNSQIRLAVLAFIEATDGAGHDEVLKLLAADGDPAVSNRAKGLLAGPKRPANPGP